MIPGLSGTILSHDALEAANLTTSESAEAAAVHRLLLRWQLNLSRNARSCMDGAKSIRRGCQPVLHGSRISDRSRGVRPGNRRRPAPGSRRCSGVGDRASLGAGVGNRLAGKRPPGHRCWCAMVLTASTAPLCDCSMPRARIRAGTSSSTSSALPGIPSPSRLSLASAPRRGVRRQPSFPARSRGCALRTSPGRRPRCTPVRRARCARTPDDGLPEGSAPATHAGDRNPSHASGLRRIAARHLSCPVSSLRRGARAGAELASRFPGELHRRSVAANGRGRAHLATGSGKRCKRSRGWPTAAAGPARCASRRSMDDCSLLHTLLWPTRCRSTTSLFAMRCWH